MPPAGSMSRADDAPGTGSSRQGGIAGGRRGGVNRRTRSPLNLSPPEGFKVWHAPGREYVPRR